MERDIINDWKKTRNTVLSPDAEEKLILYCGLIDEANRKFNITGYKSRKDILKHLILGSIEPLCDIIVPRGTSFFDLGSGAGVPGIVLGIFFPGISGLLVDSSAKKAEFINSAIQDLQLGSLRAVCGRAESLASAPGCRESFDWCFARAFAKLYVTIELGAPFVKPGGCLYVYSGQECSDFPEGLRSHSGNTGLRIMSHKEMSESGLYGPGICFKKEMKTPEKYPRRFAVIKREAERFE